MGWMKRGKPETDPAMDQKAANPSGQPGDRAEQNAAMDRGERGMISRTCRYCGRTIVLPENVQYWPDCCQVCRARIHPVEPITRQCRRCGKRFTFQSDLRRWPQFCPDCQGKAKG